MGDGGSNDHPTAEKQLQAWADTEVIGKPLPRVDAYERVSRVRTRTRR